MRYKADVACFMAVSYDSVDNSGRALWGVYCFQPIKHCDREFERHSGHGCISAFSSPCLCCPVYAETLRLADSPSRGAYQMSVNKFPNTGGQRLHWSLIATQDDELVFARRDPHALGLNADTSQCIVLTHMFIKNSAMKIICTAVGFLVHWYLFFAFGKIRLFLIPCRFIYVFI
jgi:hypothetical protein